jgi:hypothetical protein
MAAAVARQKDNFDLAEAASMIRVRGLAEGRVERDFLDAIEPAHLVEAAAADYAEYRFSHPL